MKEPDANIPVPGFDSLKDSMTPAAKLFNWNIITKALDAYGVTLNEGEKNLIVAGDLQVLVEMLANIRGIELMLSNKSVGKSQLRSSQQSQPSGVRNKTGKTASNALFPSNFF